MKYSVAKARAIEFNKQRKEPIRIAKANKKEDYYLLFENEEITKNFKVIETVNEGAKSLADDFCSQFEDSFY